jgi:hypothetical protein
MGIDLFHMWAQMGMVAKFVAFVLFIMSFWSVGVAVERIYTFSQARKHRALRPAGRQAPQGRPPEGSDRAVAVGAVRYSHLAKVVLAGHRNTSSSTTPPAAKLNREDLLDTVRRAIQRATALPATT